MPKRPTANPPSIEKDAIPSPATGAALLASLVASIASIFLFAWLAETVFHGGMVRFDALIRGWVHGFASPPMTTAMVTISHIGAEVLVAVFATALVLFLVRRWNRAAVWLATSMAGALVLDLSLKHGFHRARPVPFFGIAPHSYSFPSGHALFSFCIYGVLAGLLARRMKSNLLAALVWTAAALLIAAIGLSRIYLGVHYPTDVLAGYLAGAIWVTALIAADRYHKHRRAKSPARS